MANICVTSYRVFGKKEILDEIYGFLQKMTTDREEDYGWGKMALENFFGKLGFKADELDCRGEIVVDSIEYAKDVLSFGTETKWSRSEDVEKKLIEKYDDAISVYFLEEELGYDIFQTNDSDGTVFPECVIIDEEDECMEYYTREAAIEKLSELIGQKISSIEEAYDYTNAINARHNEEGTTGHIWIHEAQVVEN